MRASARNAFQVLFWFLLLVILLRLFPILFGLVARAGLGMFQFWWAILVFLLIGGVAWIMRKRNAG